MNPSTRATLDNISGLLTERHPTLSLARWGEDVLKKMPIMVNVIVNGEQGEATVAIFCEERLFSKPDEIVCDLLAHTAFYEYEKLVKESGLE